MNELLAPYLIHVTMPAPHQSRPYAQARWAVAQGPALVPGSMLQSRCVKWRFLPCSFYLLQTFDRHFNVLQISMWLNLLEVVMRRH